MICIDIVVILIGALLGIFLQICSCALLDQRSAFIRKDEKINIQFIWIVAVSAFISLALYWKFNFGYELFYYGFLFGLLIIISAVDVGKQIIPNITIMIGLVFSLVVAIGASLYFKSFDYIFRMVMGFLAGGVPLFLVILISRGGMGAGDMKLLAMIGGLMGVLKGSYYVFVVLVISILIGGLAGVVLLLFKQKNMKSQLPFGPFISMATFLAIMFDQQIETFLAVYYHVYL